MNLDHNKKMKVIETMWNLEFKYKKLRLKLEDRGITKNENNLLVNIESDIKEIQISLHDSLPNEPNYIFKSVLN